MSIIYRFQHPERVVFGQKVAQQVGWFVKDLGGQKVFLVTGKVVSSLDTFGDI